MNRFGLALSFTLLASTAGAQSLGTSPQVINAAPPMQGAAPAGAMAMPQPGSPGAIGGGAAPMAGVAGTSPPPPGASGAAGGGAAAGIVGLRGAMIAHKGTVYDAADIGASTEGFMTIENQSNNPDILTSVTCTIATTTTIVGADGKPITKLPVDPGKPVLFSPKGPHIVLANIHYSVPDASTIPCSLTFQYAGAIQAFLFAVKKPSPTEP